ncbi:uncharacterized protein CELE_W09C2.8 [Caenorhabditis elegans]|uniref:Uncharacterized protein n=1 Tax=Caenorhabditis elegans TaxID=6239 RepID=C1P631_CAEEL|nr:Uncharacterized protein CELE_W09C2.8 [Caenorhabditis elegans]CAX65078.1 Uncharacterized protein CELE_W09C2.8 [Caenorhabditis elegans]|eukprot:NP_001255407.1 Uncharacterized protein CELE_W09C2.8 [Caenorhabditis elegans]
MKIHYSIILFFALILLDLATAESEKTNEILGKKKFNRRNKAKRPDDFKSQIHNRPPRAYHGNNGYRTTNKPWAVRPGGK